MLWSLAHWQTRQDARQPWLRADRQHLDLFFELTSSWSAARARSRATCSRLLLHDLHTGHIRGFSIEQSQVAAWEEQITILKDALSELADLADVGWGVAFEFPIPRRQRYIDTVILARNVIFVLEFKTGDGRPSADALRQVEDYALNGRAGFRSKSTCSLAQAFRPGDRSVPQAGRPLGLLLSPEKA